MPPPQTSLIDALLVWHSSRGLGKEAPAAVAGSESENQKAIRSEAQRGFGRAFPRAIGSDNAFGESASPSGQVVLFAAKTFF